MKGPLLRISVALIYFFLCVRVALRFFCLLPVSTSFVLVSSEFKDYEEIPVVVFLGLLLCLDFVMSRHTTG